jgi:CheY-like chemotaxis protein
VTSEADAYDSAAAAARNVDTRLEAIGAHIDQIVLLLDRQQTTRTGCGTPTIGCDAVVIVNECLGFFRPAADMKRLSLNLAVAPGVQSEIIVDPAALRQVLLNLLSNAVKFTVEGAIEVRLRPMCNGATLRIEVTDTGPGISGERHRLLFQDLERADAPVTNRIMGGGLGLSLAARAAVSIGGQLRHSDNPGGGSIFSLDLPVAPKSCPPTTEVLSNREAGMARPSGPADRVLRIMIVDDTLMHRDLASVVLSEAGHEVRSVTSASEAIKVASQEDLDLVLMDIRMPTMSGLEATRHIRSLKDARGRVPILALTAQSSAEQIEKCRAAGMNGHVAKPFDAPSLLAAVLRAAAVRQRSGGRYPWLGNASAAGP